MANPPPLGWAAVAIAPASGITVEMRTTRRTLIAGGLVGGGVAAAGTPPAAELRFAAADGVALSGRGYGGGTRGVVLAPGGHGVGATWHLQAERLARAGFRVLALDYRGRGPASSVPPEEARAPEDVIGAVRRLRADGAARVAIVGASWGGWAAAAASTAMPGSVHRLALLAPSRLDAPETITVPTLFAVAREDRDGSGKLRLDAIRRDHDRVRGPKDLQLLDGAAHAQFLFLTEQGERLYAMIERFLAAR